MIKWFVHLAGHSLECYSYTHTWEKLENHTVYRPDIILSEPTMVSKVCQNSEANICLSLEGSDGI